MTTIQPSYTPYLSLGANGVSQLSNNQLALDTLDPSQKQGNTNSNIFGNSYSMSLSPAALNMLNGLNGINSNTAGNNNDSSDPGVLSVDELLNEFGGSNNLGIPTIAYSAGAVVPAALNGPEFTSAEFADGGPLPAFLAYVDKAMNLNSTQQQSLANIATAFENAPGTSQTVYSIAAALQQAGIPETI